MHNSKEQEQDCNGGGEEQQQHEGAIHNYDQDSDQD